MKTTVALASTILIALNAFAYDLVSNDQHEKVRKALISTIKTQYDTWLINEQAGDEIAMPDSDMTGQRIVTEQQSNSEAPSNQKHIFSEFEFKIGQGQAIVRFKVDHKTVSAFFEEKDHHWKLVCAAFIPPVL